MRLSRFLLRKALSLLQLPVLKLNCQNVVPRPNLLGQLAPKSPSVRSSPQKREVGNKADSHLVLWNSVAAIAGQGQGYSTCTEE